MEHKVPLCGCCLDLVNTATEALLTCHHINHISKGELVVTVVSGALNGAFTIYLQSGPLITTSFS